MFVMDEDIALPNLRQDLRVESGIPEGDGSPTWMLYDRLSDNYFKIGTFEFECLRRFGDYEKASQLAAAIRKETTLDADLNDIKGFVAFLLYNSLLLANTPDVQRVLMDAKERKKHTFFIMDIFKKYMYTNVVLFEPQAFLKKIYPYVSPLFTKTFFMIVLCVMACGIYLTVQRWDDFVHTFSSFFNLEGVMLILFVTIFVKFFHEFSHALMAYKYNVPVSAMGAIFIVIYPILYTETTNVWRLLDRKKRIRVALAGLMAEFSLAAFALILWHLLEPGFWQNVSYFVAFISFAISVFINMNPLMKFDGYYFLSDLLKIDNLQSRSVHFFKWFLRQTLFNLNDDTPEVVPESRQKFLIFFGFSLAIYRVFLYMAIGLLIYHLFFKPLGAILMAGMLIVFLGIPVYKELTVWYKERARIMVNLRAKIFFGLVFIGFVMACLPLQNTVRLPAVMHAENYTAIYPFSASTIDVIHVKNGDVVKKDDVLFSLSSQTFDEQIQMAQLKIDLYQTIKERQQSSLDLAKENKDIDQLILEGQAVRDGLLRQKEDLTMTAKFDGTVRDISSEIHEGRHINPATLLGRVVDGDNLNVTAYISDKDVARVIKDTQAYFMPDGSYIQKIPLQLVSVAPSDTRAIAFPELASVFNGAIPADMADVDGGERALVSRLPIYGLEFTLTEAASIHYTPKGSVVLDVKAESLFGRFFERFVSLFIRESGV